MLLSKGLLRRTGLFSPRRVLPDFEDSSCSFLRTAPASSRYVLFLHVRVNFLSDQTHCFHLVNFDITLTSIFSAPLFRRSGVGSYSDRSPLRSWLRSQLRSRLRRVAHSTRDPPSFSGILFRLEHRSGAAGGDRCQLCRGCCAKALRRGWPPLLAQLAGGKTIETPMRTFNAILSKKN